MLGIYSLEGSILYKIKNHNLIKYTYLVTKENENGI